MRHHGSNLVAALFVLTLALLAAACGSDETGSTRGYVTIEPLGSATPMVVASTAPIGGTPAAPTGGATPESSPIADDTEAPATTEPLVATETPAPSTMDGSEAPAAGRWIDVNVTTFVVRLMDGTTSTREITPVGVGVQVDTGVYESTQTGLFHVYDKNEALVYDPPYDTYISHWVGFDPDRANGFHSFLKDAAGNVVDNRTGRISNGCIRTPDPDVVFAFAEIGMPVFVHR